MSRPSSSLPSAATSSLPLATTSSLPLEAPSASVAPTTDPSPSAAPLSLLTGHGIKGGSAGFPPGTSINDEDIEIALVLADLRKKPDIRHSSSLPSAATSSLPLEAPAASSASLNAAATDEWKAKLDRAKELSLYFKEELGGSSIANGNSFRILKKIAQDSDDPEKVAKAEKALDLHRLINAAKKRQSRNEKRKLTMSDLDTLTLRELHEPGFPKIGIIGRPSLEIQLHKDAFFRKLKKITESAERGDEEAQKQLDDLSKNFPEYEEVVEKEDEQKVRNRQRARSNMERLRNERKVDSHRGDVVGELAKKVIDLENKIKVLRKNDKLREVKKAQDELHQVRNEYNLAKNSLPSDSVSIEKHPFATSASVAPTTDHSPSAAPLSLLTGLDIGGSAVFPTRTPIDHTKAPLTPSHTSEDIEVALVLDLGEKPKIQHLAPSSTSTAIESSSAANHRKRPVSTEEAPSLAPQPTRTNSEDRPLKKPTTRTASA